jgi:hypothetical protein
MTALEDEVAAATQALDLGTQLSQSYYEAASQSPGLGLQVSLPSVPSPLGPVVGEGFDVAPSAPALRPVRRPKLVPQYGSEPLGGAAYHQAAGVQWPAGTAPLQVGRRADSIAFVSPRSRPSVSARIRSARRSLIGR